MSNISKGMNYNPLPRKVGGQESKIPTVGEPSGAKFMGTIKSMRNVLSADYGDTKGWKKFGLGLKNVARGFVGLGPEDAKTAEDPNAAAMTGDNSEELAALKEQVEKNTYDISTLGPGAGSGLTFKGSVYGKEAQVFKSENHPLRKTGCAKKY